MPLVKTSEESYILNHGDFINEIYKNCLHQTIDGNFCIDFAFKQEYFNVDAPYIMSNDQRRGKKKRKSPMNEEEIQEQKYHDSISQKLRETLAKSQTALKDISVCTHQSAASVNVEWGCGKCSAIFRDLCFRRLYSETNEIIEIQQDIATHLNLHHVSDRIVNYNGHKPRTVCIDGEYYLLPQKCSFLFSDVSRLEPLIKCATEIGGFDVIVIDPPWENKSAKRGKKYSWLSLGDIGKIPLHRFARDGCIVALWVTNKQKVHRFVKDELFSANEIQYISEWHWIKITNSGQPVVDFTSLHKRPYETMIIGRYRGGEDIAIPTSVLISTPCTIHSHKPPLDEIICNYLTVKQPRCLELFARSLKPHWTSWGNEVLDLQNIKYFDSSELK